VKNRVLNIGPSVDKSFGGMVTVINQIKNSCYINEKNDIFLYPTYIDGCNIKRALYSIKQCFKFWLKKLGKKYDVYHLHTASFMSTYRKRFLACLIKKYKKNYVVHIHGAEYIEFYQNESAKKKCKIKKFLEDASYVIVLSEFWKRAFENVVGIKNCIVVNNCIDFEHYNSISKQYNKDFINFLYLGRVGHRKGMWDVIEATKILKDKNYTFKVLVAGDGEIDKFNELVEHNGLHDYFVYNGWADNKLKDHLLSVSDVLLLPSYNEGLPMSILESMASGLVILSSNVGSIPEVVIENENGYIIEPGHIDQLVEKMISCFDYKKNRIISYNNKEKIKNIYDICIFEKKIETIYNELSKKNK